MSKIESFFEKYNYVFCAVLAVLYVHSRYKYLGEISYYMHIDELKSAYESYCLAHFGTEAFGGGINLPVILSAVLMKLKGGLFSLKLFRLLSVAGGLFGMLFSYLVVLQSTGKKKYAFLEALLVTVLPVFFIAQRTGVGEWYSLYMIPAAYYFLLRGCAIRSICSYAAAGIMFALILFTGNTAVFSTLVFLVIVTVYLMLLRQMKTKEVAALVVPPIIGVAVIAFTGGFAPRIGISNIWYNVTNIRSLLWNDMHPFNISPIFGSVYVFSVPVIAVGAVVSARRMIGSIKNRIYDHSVILWLFIVAELICDLMTPDADIQTSAPLFFAVSLLITEGLIYIAQNLKVAYVIVLAAYLLSFWAFTHYYYENFNSEVNNSVDHEQGMVVDKSIGEAIKTTMKMLPDSNISVISDDFEHRNLMIALFAGATPAEYESFKDEDSFSFGKVSVNSGEDVDTGGNTVYIVNQAEHQDIIDNLTAMGWGNLYLKEYTVCFMH